MAWPPVPLSYPTIRVAARGCPPGATRRELTAAKAAASVMGTNSVCCRFVHLVHGDCAQMPAKPGVDGTDFELWSLAASAVNDCGMCMESHEEVLLQHGVGKDAVQAVVRVAAVVHATAATLEAEEALAGAPAGLAAAA